MGKAKVCVKHLRKGSYRLLIVVLLLLTNFAVQNSGFRLAQNGNGTLKLSIVDEISNQPTPTRIEVLDQNGKAYVAEDALSIEQPMPLLSKAVLNPYTRTEQFYGAGNSKLSLPPGTYKLKVYKGIEYRVSIREVQVQAGKTAELKVPMSRWTDLPEQGWFGADDHIHIPRPVETLNVPISQWMQAEDIHVANLLQWGHSRDFKEAIQYRHGPAGLYQEGKYILAAGQENPRTNILGHTVILGASSPINFPDRYIIYQLFWEEAKRQGALSGYAHYGLYGGAQYGLSIDLPQNLLTFMEVVQGDAGIYDVWYEILNLGFRMTPTGGSDYYISYPSKSIMLPGRERFYTQVKGPLTYSAWLEGVRQGRTFATNGPILEFRVNGKSMGEEVVLTKPGSVLVEGAVRFEPARDNVRRLEVIENGRLLRSFPRKGQSPDITFRFKHEVLESSWLAVRAWGSKADEARFLAPTNAVMSTAITWGEAYYPASVCHSAPAYVTIENAPRLSAHPRAKALARTWLARLENLEARLTEDQIQYLTEPPPGFADDVPTENFRKNRSSLLKLVKSAKRRFSDLAQ